MTTTAYLVSAAPGDHIDGTDVALLDGVQALDNDGAREWMAGQGYGADDPGELMYLCEEPPPAGWEFLAVELSAADASVLADARAEDDRQREDRAADA